MLLVEYVIYSSVCCFFKTIAICIVMIPKPKQPYPSWTSPNAKKPLRHHLGSENQLFRLLRADDKEGWQRLMEGKQGDAWR